MADCYLTSKQGLSFAIVFLVVSALATSDSAAQRSPQEQLSSKQPNTIRIATFNTSLNRKAEGQLARELSRGDSARARRVAEVLRRVRPDVVLLNEFDFDSNGDALQAFQKRYLEIQSPAAPPLRLPHHYLAAVNTGAPSGLDLDGDGVVRGPQDCYGFGAHEGQFGMVVLSRYPIRRSRVRTFQKFLWSDMPGAKSPTLDGRPYYADKIWRRLRLSSKSIWDLPIVVNSTTTIHLIASHPTPPVFDGPEDRNGVRNRDEIRFLADYVTTGKGEYCYDDQGARGGLVANSHFVIAGDLNADPNDGDSTDNPARALLRSAAVNDRLTPQSRGGQRAAELAGGANKRHSGPHRFDTAAFSVEKVGNLRVDYVLPSKSLETVRSGVFWPLPETPQSDLLQASDHRLVWVDVALGVN